ncbi:hypothetical protein HG530_012391 [Fusarium avenaceum]|nr:hypothetical protein HG530_012391 [Fusarium avenaceum]
MLASLWRHILLDRQDLCNDHGDGPANKRRLVVQETCISIVNTDTFAPLCEKYALDMPLGGYVFQPVIRSDDLMEQVITVDGASEASEEANTSKGETNDFFDTSRHDVAYSSEPIKKKESNVFVKAEQVGLSQRGNAFALDV